MNPEQQRIAIAEACGLDVIHEPAGPADRPDAWRTGFFTPEAAKQRRERWPSSCVVSVIPGYLNDLNAMCAAETRFNDSKDADVYVRHLLKICRNLITREDSFVLNTWTTYALVHATAAQRAEAFLRTLNLWTDNK